MEERHSVAVFKMHGSVSWTVGEDQTRTEASSIDDLIASEHHVAGINVPGPAKLRASESTLWKAAMKKVEEAESIHIVGYRFPETDSSVLADFLAALQQNESLQSIEIVLGPDVNQPFVRRLESIFGHLRSRGCFVGAHPLFAQDYLLLTSNGISRWLRQ